jgi:H+/gluconate symporter-like permease
MKLDDLKQDWQETIRPPSTENNLTEVIAMLEKETTKIDKEIKRRDILEISIAMLLIPVWIYGLFTSAGTLQTLGYIVALVACLYIPYRLVNAKKVFSPKDTSINAFLESEKQKVMQQKKLLESIVSWYIAPLATAIVLITLGSTVDATGLPHLNDFLIQYYGLLALLIVGVYFLNKRAAKKKFGPLLENIEQRLSELQQQ